MIFARVVVADLWYKERSDWVASLRRCPPTETSLIDFAVSNLLNHFLENNSPLLCEFQTSKDPPHSKFFQKAALVWLYSCAAQDWKEREKNPSRFSFFGGFSYNFIHFTLQSKTFSISSTCRLQLLTLALPRSLSQHRSPSPLRMLPVEANTNWAKFKIRMVVLTLYPKLLQRWRSGGLFLVDRVHLHWPQIWVTRLQFQNEHRATPTVNSTFSTGILNIYISTCSQ